MKLVEIEVAKLKPTIPVEEIEKCIIELLTSKKINKNSLYNIQTQRRIEIEELNIFKDDIHCVIVNDIPEKFDSSMFKFYYYEFSDHSDPESELIESHGEEEIASSLHWVLPNKTELHGLWESLIFEDNLKEDLLDFAKTILLFSKIKVDQNIISCNRIMFFYGPAGTGKTSLAKALAQKLSIQLYDKYQFTHLFEINSHSLFSKWFSESGKLVMKMFEQIQEVIEMESSLVVVLIDEIESIAFNRENISSNEPSDSVRVVNAVLTQLDKIKKYPNVLIITTSNLTKSIDLAFLDRADIVRYIGQPSTEAIYKIISSAVIELARKGIIIADSEDDGRDEFNINSIDTNEHFHDLEKFPPFSTANIMSQVCKEATGLSGRCLRKLPYIAHALFLKKNEATLREFLISMRYAVDHVKRNKRNMNLDQSTNNIENNTL